jgi:uncharacterized protein (DUF302 family)
MSDYGRRIVVDADFGTALQDVHDALDAEQMQVIAAVDLRDHFRHECARDFRRYTLIQAWSRDLAYKALRHDLDTGALLTTTIAVYELADGETAVVAGEPWAAVAGDSGWRLGNPELCAIADHESDRVARVLGRLQYRARDMGAVDSGRRLEAARIG